MIDILISTVVNPWCLFGAAVVFALAGQRACKHCMLWVILSAVCVILGSLWALVIGGTLEELLTAVLPVTAVSLLALPGDKGGKGE